MNDARGRVLGALIVTGVALLVQPSASHATLITFGFSGVVDTVVDNTSVLDGSVGVGTPFSGYYTFDPSVPDVHSNPFYGEYQDAIVALHVEVGSYVLNEIAADRYNGIGVEVPPLISSYSAQAGSHMANHMVDAQAILIDYDLQAIQSVDIPLVPPDLSPFEERYFSVSERYVLFGFGGPLDDLWLVPEPGSACLLLLGAGLVAVRRRK